MKKFFCHTLLFFITISFGQTTDLKVGLVLSGGGAKGIAHVGALKVIEETGVRIDYIGGSSMGAVVGALYAVGYSAAQIESMLRETDLNQLIADQYPRRAISGNSFVLAAFTFDYNFNKKHHLLAKANFANVGQDIYIDES